MGIATQPSSQLTFSYLTRPQQAGPRSPASMSQGFHQQHHGLFSFSEGFDRASQEHPHHHIAQQSRRDKLRVQGFDVAGAGAGAHPLALIEEQGDDPSIFESTSVDGAAGSMLSDMFGFPAAPAGPSGVDQMQANYQLLPRPAAAMAGFSGDWYGPNRQIHQQPPQPDPAAAMQLFLMNPSSPSRTHQGFQSFGETPFGGRVVEGRGLSLSLSSSLQPLEHMAKAFHNQQPAQQPALHLQLQSHVQAGQVLHGHTQMNILRSSKYAKPAQELLEEFCSVGRGQLKGARAAGRRHGGSSTGNANPSGGGGSTSAAASTSSSKDVPPLSPADRFEHQRKRAKLISMLDEVERRYNHYCDQMQAVVNSFDTAMGFGAATPYTALAQKAMSRHFRCLKDVIAAQLKQTCELLGEKEGAIGSGVTKGETPRLRLLDQNLRQQRAFNQMGMMEQEAWRPQRGLPERSVSVLRGWLFEHFLHPYPSDADKHFLMRQTGLSRNQVTNWFINARVRLWKPMVEEMYLQESNEQRNGENEEKECSETNQSQQEEEEEEQEEQQQQQQSQRPETNAASESKASPGAPSVGHRNHRFASSSETPPPGSAVAHHSSGGVDDSILMFNADALAHMGDVYQHQYGQAGRLRLGAAGDVSLTLGLRHAGGGGAPEKSRFSVRDFSG